MTPTTEAILKQETVGYLKSKINLQQANLYMTDKKIILEAGKTGVGGLGLLGALFKNHVEKVNTIFDLNYEDIQSLSQGKHGLQKNVLEITDKQGSTFRIIVKDYQEWEEAIKKMCK